MISQPINLSKFYQLTFSGAKALVDQISWDKVPGRNKLRKFFLRDRWQDDIVRISVSSSGAKGGVFFLEVDLLEKQALDVAIGDTAKSDQIWKQLIIDELITTEGIKTLAGRTGLFNSRRPAYTNNVNKIKTLLTTRNIKRQFVVKGTEEPGRTLFAEYVLSRVGRAKIPKALILEVDPTRPHNGPNPSEGMIMLDLLRDATKRNPNTDAQKYANSYAFLDDGQGTPNSCVSYLVVQKLIVGSTFPTASDVNAEIMDFLVDQNLKITEMSFFTDAGMQGVSANDVADLITELKRIGCITNGGIVDPQYQTNLANLAKLNNRRDDIARILKAVRDTLDNYGLQFQTNSTYAQFDELALAMQQAGDSPLRQAFQALRARQTGYMQTVETILNNSEMMFNVGCILFADLPIGNGDRFENMNSGNFFFINKQATKFGKVNYPIGCIDNDAFMHTYMPKRTAPVVEGFTAVDDYVAGLLQDGTPEFWGMNNAPPANTVFASSAALVQMLKVGKWFDNVFITTILGATMPKCVVQLLSANCYDPTDTSMYLKSKQLPLWQNAKQKIQEGVCHALLDYQSIPLYDFRHVYATLADRYGKGINFDFMAFEVRDRYLREAQINKSNWSIILPDFAEIQVSIVGELQQKVGGTGLSRIIQTALSSAEGNSILAKANITPGQVIKLLIMLPMNEQEALLPCPFGLIFNQYKQEVHFGALSEKAREDVLKRWGKLDQKYQRRINAVICTILAKLVTDYETEIRHFRFTYFFIQDSFAYRDALYAAKLFSRLKLYKDDGSQRKDRNAELLKYGLGDYL